MRMTCESPSPVAAGHLGRPAPLGSPVFTKFAKYACIASDTLWSSGAQSYTLLDPRFPIAYSISAECTAPVAAGGLVAGALAPEITPPARPGTALPIDATICGRGRA